MRCATPGTATRQTHRRGDAEAVLPPTVIDLDAIAQVERTKLANRSMCAIRGHGLRAFSVHAAVQAMA
jgi:hypothetical protein